jgi:hypothetical protein
MLDQLSSEFELILFSAQPRDYTRDLAKLLTLAPPPDPKKRDPSPQTKQVAAASQATVFSHILSKEDCIYNEELDRYIVDLDIFTGANCEYPRDLGEVMFVTDSYSRV